MRPAALLLALALLAGPALGAVELNFGVSRVTPQGEDSSWLVRLDLQPGSTKREDFLVRNYGKEPLRLQVYAADAFTGPEGGVGGLASGEVNRDAGLWLRPDRTDLRIDPGNGQGVQVRLQVPPDAAPGDHLAYVFLENPDTLQDPSILSPMQRSGFQFLVKTRLGLLFWLRLPGGAAAPIELSAPVKAYADEGLAVTLRARNPGTLLQKYGGTWELLTSRGTRLAGGEVVERVLLPGGDSPVRLGLTTDTPLPRGEYRLVVRSVTRCDERTVEASQEFPLPLP